MAVLNDGGGTIGCKIRDVPKSLWITTWNCYHLLHTHFSLEIPTPLRHIQLQVGSTGRGKLMDEIVSFKHGSDQSFQILSHHIMGRVLALGARAWNKLGCLMTEDRRSIAADSKTVTTVQQDEGV
jgi:hypothetical protein